MKSAKSIGRVTGILLLIHLVTGLTVPYIMLQPLNKGPLGFLSSAAENAFQFRVAVMMLFVGGALTVAIAITAWPVFRRHSFAMALWLLALATVNFALQVVENSHWLSLLFLSQEAARAGAAEASLFQSLGLVVRSSWKWAHYAHLLILVSWIFMLLSLLYRGAEVPRALAVLGLIGALLQIFGITLPVLLDYYVPNPQLFGLPLGLAYLLTALWLSIRGFNSQDDLAEARARSSATVPA